MNGVLVNRGRCWLALVACTAILMCCSARNLVLKSVDCEECRNAIGMFQFLSPNDYNMPISYQLVSSDNFEVAVFPRYVGPHFVQFYSDGVFDSGPSVRCSDEVDVKLVTPPLDRHRVFSVHGSGLILGSIFISPKVLNSGKILTCKFEFQHRAEGLLVVSRASGL
jgi:hypothetical protein